MDLEYHVYLHPKLAITTTSSQYSFAADRPAAVAVVVVVASAADRMGCLSHKSLFLYCIPQYLCLRILPLE